jgi:transposase-like protein
VLWETAILVAVDKSGHCEQPFARYALIGFQGRGMGGCRILMSSHFPTPDRSPTLQVNIKNLIDEVQCYQTVRALRWPDGIACPSCQSTHVIKRGFDDTEPARQRYECHDCDKRFDDLTDTIFAGHHQPLKVWILCLYFMGLNFVK